MSKILIVDDNGPSRDLLRAILKSVCPDIIEAQHGQEALDLIPRERPDLVLMDIDMPVLDGLAAVRKIRENPSLKDLPVIAITSFAMEGEREKGLAAGFTAYMMKPIRSAALRNQVQQLLGRALA